MQFVDLYISQLFKFWSISRGERNNLVHASIKYAADESGLINIVASIFKNELVHFKCKAQLEVT